MIEVRTQAELDKVLARTHNGADELIACIGGGRFVAWGNSSVEAWENSSVEAWENSSVEAWENSSVEAWGNSSVEARGNSSVEAWENSSVEAWENSSVEAWGNVMARTFGGKVKATPGVVVMRHHPQAEVTGGQIIEVTAPQSAEEWCEFYGVEIKRGLAILYKATGPDYETRGGIRYTPGTKPKAPDWDPEPECGGGLQFSPHPKMAREFNREAAHFVACPVRVSEIVVHPEGVYPHKVKAPRVAGKCFEVTADAERVTP